MKRCCFSSNPEEIVTPKEKRCDGNFYVQEAKSTESVIICIHGTRLPSGEETTSSADRSDRSVEGGSDRVTCSSSTGYTARAILTISNDESPYFQSSPLPHPVAVPEACRLARSPPWDQKQGQARLDCPCAAPRPPAL
ncbi:hypothetical protein T4C_10348 [Trichinella pseudospiralis]|uniref:Uncharacterized protein n=1 Tax=Trichinella pseudospiralis TaxID=6337 RepID=A0A0V1JXK5_TRIPS|nr:hypothetical protein T4C_10348 [Trichinella pseudospiralis]